MSGDRHLDWEGCFNVRDLGGLRTKDGGLTRRGSVVRADALGHLTPAGWAALQAYGIRTVVDLRNPHEWAEDTAPRPEGVATVRVALDGIEHRDFWDYWESGPQFGTPLYYRPFLGRFADRIARVIAAIAQAAPGGLAFHCAGGRDRTGLVSLVLLTLAGVPADEIAADYVLSTVRLRAFWGPRGLPDQEPAIEAFLAAQGTRAEDVIVSLVESFDARGYLRDAGLCDEELAAVRARLRDR